MQTDQKPIVGAIIIAGILIAGAIMLRGSSTGTIPVAGNDGSNNPPQLRAINKDEHILGNPNAKIVVVEYSDLECPYCQRFHKTMHQIVEGNDDVAWVYRHYPIPQLHPKAFQEAEATECAWEQGGNDAFWKYTDRVFEITPSNNGLGASELPRIAEYVGLDVALFNECLASGKFAEKIQADMEDGTRAGVQGTPSSFILKNGKLVDTIPGALSFESIIQKLDALK